MPRSPANAPNPSRSTSPYRPSDRSPAVLAGGIASQPAASRNAAYFQSGLAGAAGGWALLANFIEWAMRVTYAGASWVRGWKVHSSIALMSSAWRTHSVTRSLSFMCCRTRAKYDSGSEDTWWRSATRS